LTRYQKIAKAAIPSDTPNASPSSAETRPEAMGRSFVRVIRVSMSRSNHMLMALAPPAMR
jgi:hypothetical protein